MAFVAQNHTRKARNEAVTYTSNHLITRGTGGNAVLYRLDCGSGLRAATAAQCLPRSSGVGTASAPRFFEYDPDNNLIAAHAGPTNWSFRYNAQNQMAWSQLKVNGTVADERCYLYDGLDCIAEVTPNGTLLREFIRNGAIGGIVAEKIHNDPTVPSEYRNTTLYYHYNHRGDTVSVSDGNGTHIWQSDYDAFGRPLPVKSASGAFAPRYTFSTKRYFSELGTYYYGYRWYLPELCRWMQKDPIRSALNHFRICFNNPLINVDPYGLHVLTTEQGRAIGHIHDKGYTSSRKDRDATHQALTSSGIKQVSPENSTVNCHSAAYRPGESVWIDNPEAIIKDEYTQIQRDEVQPGDKVTYYNQNEEAVHSGTITEEGEIRSKLGESGEYDMPEETLRALYQQHFLDAATREGRRPRRPDGCRAQGQRGRCPSMFRFRYRYRNRNRHGGLPAPAALCARGTRAARPLPLQFYVTSRRI